MKKYFVLLLVLSLLIITCSKDNPLGANAVITQVDLQIGLTGDTIIITGTGFTNASQLSGTLNGNAITVQSATSTSLVASVPPGIYTAGDLVINGGPVPINFPYSFDITGTIFGITNSGGTSITITGAFPTLVSLTGLTLSVNDIPYTIVSATATQIVANSDVTTDPKTLYNAPIKIGTTGQSIKKGLPFVILNITPTSGTSGTSVTISGLGFSFNKQLDTVKFNGVTATTSQGSGTMLVVTAPQNGSTGPVSITVGPDTYVGPVFTYPEDVSTFAGSGLGGSANGQGTAASFSAPENGAFDSKGNLFVADYGNNLIRMITPDGTVSTFAGKTTSGFSNGQGTNATFKNPSGLIFDTQGNLFVSDEGNNAIRKIDPQGNVTTFAGTGLVGFRDAQGTSAAFDQPIGLAIDPISNLLYVADSRNNAIRTIDLTTASVSTIAGSGQPGSKDGDISNGDAVNATFNSPRGLALVTSGSAGSETVYLFVADYSNNKIREIILNYGAASVFTLAGNSGNAPGFTNIPATFNGPNSVCIGYDRSGNRELFIADASNHAIRYSTSDPVSALPGNMPVNTLAGTGSIGLTNGNYNTATFHFPDGVAYNPKDGNLYVIEFGNNDIRKIILQ
jgi:IPT/TIG domain